MGRKKGQSITQKTKTQLKEYFVQGGISARKVGEILKIDHKTVSKYWKEYADELTQLDEHEDWFDIEKRVRQRSLERLTERIEEQRTTLEPLEKKFSLLLNEKTLLKQTDPEEFDFLERTERMVRLNKEKLDDLTDQYDALEMSPPNEVLFFQEMELRIAEKNKLSPSTTQE